MSTRRLPGRSLVLGLVVILLVTAFIAFSDGPETKQLSARFDRAVSLYVGSDVRILGVNVGEVTAVVPEGEAVRVEMEYDAGYEVPADAQAVIVTPTLMADRFVQLTPVHTGGPVMADGADIPLQQTGSPVELDRIYGSLSMLANALGPNGANADGSLNELLSAGARTLDGRGATANRMIRDLSMAAQTFGNNSGELFATVEQLNAFTQTLAANDRLVNRFMEDLGTASSQLEGEREELDAMLRALARAIRTVESFVRDNRKLVVGRVEELTTVLDQLVKEKDSLATALEKGPVGAGNLALAFDSKTGSIGARVNVSPNIEDFDGFLCALVQNSDVTAKDAACELFEKLLEPSDLQLPAANNVQLPDSRVPGESEPAGSLDELMGGAS